MKHLERRWAAQASPVTVKLFYSEYRDRCGALILVTPAEPRCKKVTKRRKGLQKSGHYLTNTIRLDDTGIQIIVSDTLLVFTRSVAVARGANVPFRVWAAVQTGNFSTIKTMELCLAWVRMRLIYWAATVGSISSSNPNAPARIKHQ